MVTTTTRTSVRSAAEMRFGIVQRVQGDGGEASVEGEVFRVAARLPAHEEGDFLQLLLRRGIPGGRAGGGNGVRPLVIPRLVAGIGRGTCINCPSASAALGPRDKPRD